ncbi:MAG: glycosyltransferase [Phycisphaerales bacterium]
MPHPDSTQRHSSSDGRAQSRVLLGPTFADNPYTQRHVDSLRSLGIDVRTLDNPARLGDEATSLDQGDVFHLQWAHVFTAGRHLPASVRGTRRLLSTLDGIRRRGIRVVWTVHNLVHHEAKGGALGPKFQMWAMRQIARRCNALIVHGEHGAALVRERYRVPDVPIAVVDHPSFIGSYPAEVSQEDARAELDLPQDATVLAHVGQLRRYKGVISLINAFKQTERDNAFLLVAGRISDEPTRRALTEASDSRIRLHEGFVRDEKLQVFFRAADAVVLPYARVFTSGSAALAGTFGRAVIAPNVGCLPDQIGDAGILYPPADRDALPSALQRAMGDRDAIREMGELAWSFAQERTWDALAEAVAATYQSGD